MLLAILRMGAAVSPAEGAAEDESRMDSVPVEIVVQPVASVVEKTGGTVILSPLDQRGEELVLPIDSEGGARVSVPPATSWDVRWKGHKSWAPRQLLVVAPTDRRVELRVPLWPLGELTGGIQLEATEALPEMIIVQFEGARDRMGKALSSANPLLEGRSVCPVDPNGVFRCALPVDRLDLSIRAEGFVSHYFWDLEVAAKSARSVGELSLQRGASLVGRVELTDGSLDPRNCEVRIVPRTLPDGGPEAARVRRTATDEKVRADGFFHLGPLPPGSYALEARQPGYAPARLVPIELFERAETRLDQPLVLRRPVDVEIVIDPAVDWLLEPWQMEVARHSELTAGQESVFQGPVPRTGRLLLESQSPGRFELNLEDSIGNRFYSREVEVLPGAPASIPIHLELVLVRGRLLLGEEPIAGTLWFGGRSGARRVEFESSSKGRFSGLLPKSGAWRVEVANAERALESELWVEVSERGDVTVELPDTELTGRVVDVSGRPVGGATVRAQGTAFALTVASEESGDFTIRGFPVGPLEIWATDRSARGERWSEAHLISVQDALPAGPIELRLGGAVQPLTGRVITHRGPVAGAQILVDTLVPQSPVGSQAQTGLDGRFEVEVVEDAQSVRLVVLPPGRALEVFRLQPTSEEVELWVPEVGGTLEVTWNRTKEGTAPTSQVVIVKEGDVLPNGLLFRWARGHGERLAMGVEQGVLRIPQMAAGNYRACQATVDAMQRSVTETGSWQGALKDCAAGYLGAGTTLRLDAGGP